MLVAARWISQPRSSVRPARVFASASYSASVGGGGSGRPNIRDAGRIVGIPTREEQLIRLKEAGDVKTDFDVLIIGGGATGSGAALDAQLRGLKTALIERGDFGNETSSRSTKLIWAGIRYIGTATGQLLRMKNLSRPVEALREFWEEFSMVLGAHRERRFLLETQPHLTKWVPIAVPIQDWLIRPAPMGHPLFSVIPMVLPLVMKFYDSLGKFCSPSSHIMSHSRARRKFPQLDQANKYVQIFYEGQHNDSRTCLSIALAAAEQGAAIANYVEMQDLIFDENGRAVGAVCRDTLTGVEFDVRSKSIIFAGGPFTDALRKKEDNTCESAVSGAAGTHIVLPGYYSPPDIGLLDINTSDGRFLFFLPWLGSTLVGTTDRKGVPVSTPAPPEEEITWILREVEKYLSPDLRVRRSDVLSAWQGWRPLASDPHAEPGAPVSRDHIISTNPKTGVTFVTGGKWTTYREMAEDVVTTVCKEKEFRQARPCSTLTHKLFGAKGYKQNTAVKLIQKFGIGEDTAKHLAMTYGQRAFDVCYLSKPTGRRWPRFGKILIDGYPYIESEVEYACKEYVRSVSDMLCLRTRLAYLNVEAARSCIPRVADLMGESLGWNEVEKARQIEDAIQKLNEFGGPVPKRVNSAQKSFVGASTARDLKMLFKTLDIDGNGYLDVQEMAHAADLLGLDLNSQEVSEIFSKMDGAHDGRVYQTEFIDWWSTAQDNQLEAKLGKTLSSNLGSSRSSQGSFMG